ncbi:MAG: caspase family protein [Deltaproteobacteria bacterium]
MQSGFHHLPDHKIRRAGRLCFLFLVFPLLFCLVAGCMSMPQTISTSALVPSRSGIPTDSEPQFPVRMERFRDDRLNRSSVGMEHSAWWGVSPIVTDSDIVPVFETIVTRAINEKGIKQGSSPFVLKGAIQVANVGQMGLNRNLKAEVALELTLIDSRTGGRVWSRTYKGDGAGTDYQATLAAAMRDLASSIERDNSILAAKSIYLAQGQAPVPARTALPEDKSARPASDIAGPSFDAASRILGKNDMAVVIGIEKYQMLPASDFSINDAGLIKDYLLSLGLSERNIEFITNERATFTAIKKAIESWLPNRITIKSKVIVYYSGHGAPEPKSGSAYLVPFDGDPNYLEDTGYPLKRLYEKLGSLQAAEIMVMIDSCFSGAGGRSVLAKGARPLVLTAEPLSLPSHMAVLTATQGSQISTSSPAKGHGIFTYYFLKAIKDGKRNLPEIYETIKPQVEDEAKQLNIRQTPGLNPEAEGMKGRFSLRQ